MSKRLHKNTRFKALHGEITRKEWAKQKRTNKLSKTNIKQ